MRMTMNLPGPLVSDVMSLSGESNRTAVIVKAIGEYARRLRREKLKGMRGARLIDPAYDVLANREMGVRAKRHG